MYDDKSDINKVANLQNKDVYFQVLNDVLYICYFSKFRNSFYFFLHNTLQYYDA